MFLSFFLLIFLIITPIFNFNVYFIDFFFCFLNSRFIQQIAFFYFIFSPLFYYHFLCNYYFWFRIHSYLMPLWNPHSINSLVSYFNLLHSTNLCHLLALICYFLITSTSQLARISKLSLCSFSLVITILRRWFIIPVCFPSF